MTMSSAEATPVKSVPKQQAPRAAERVAERAAEQLSSAELKERLKRLRIDSSDCFEKSELLDRYRAAKGSR